MRNLFGFSNVLAHDGVEVDTMQVPDKEGSGNLGRESLARTVRP
jgi:hypothetical protein